MTSAIVALLMVTAVVVIFVWLGVVEDRIDAERAAQVEREEAEALRVAEECKHFAEWESEVKAS